MAKTILIIDDDPEVLVYLQEFLQDHGYATITAADGAQGLEKAHAHKPDLITLDIDMPHKSGTLFYASMRQDSQLRDIPVIVISGVGPRPPALKKGVPVLTKPIDNEALLQAIHEALP